MAHVCLRRGGAVIVQRAAKNAGETARRVPVARGLSTWVTDNPFAKRGNSIEKGRPLFKLVETDFISRELIRYDAADAELLGLYSIDEVLHNLKVITPEVDGGGANATSKLQNTTAEEGKEDSPEVSPAVTPCSDSEGFVGGGVVEDTGETVEKLAIKRTYQPSVLKRKRKHGYLSRVKTRLGKRIIQRRLEKGRWRMAV